MNEERKTEYEKIFSQQTEFGTDVIVVDETTTTKEELIKGREEVTKVIRKSIREKTLFRIKTEDGKYLNNNRFIVVKGEIVQITNPFVLFAEGAFPDEVQASFEEDGIDYSFTLKKIRSAGTEKEILCIVPDFIKVLKRRGNYRVKTAVTIPVGIYWHETSSEFIGSINDISDVGIGLKFDECYFDFEFYNTLKNSLNQNFPIIIECDGEYNPVVIKVKFVSKNDDNQIVIGAEFYFTEAQQQEKINTFVDKIRQNATFQKKKDLTTQLIQAAEMGI
jgi:c-di-GMP-binding flagellar brake protein YcgR